ncbi:MAG TPA: SDR family NAD(P)-dependent oxidoreductase [bacterium]|nr:SDR family NAD(P)-dependent oxidoreductase [bacterium]
MKSMFEGKIVLVTGGTGTVGRAIVEEILRHDPKVVRVFSRDESKQYDFQKAVPREKRLRFFVGDVRDKERLLHAMENVDFVFHTAAMKHVIACEYNPFEALKTNLLGTKNIIEASLEHKVGKVIFTSSDKATNPCNTMGVSKLFAERLVTAASYYKGKNSTVLSSVRFGNILGSRGSVIPVFRKQIESGGPITLTNPAMTRFVITKKQALDFVFKATSLAKGGEIFIPKMPVVRMKDMVDVMLELYAPENKRKSVKIELIGAQAGEKSYEELMTGEEVTRAVETDDMFILKPQIPDLFEREYHYPNERPPAVKQYTSHNDPPMAKKTLRKLIAGISADY